MLAPVSPADAQVSLALSTDAPDLNTLAVGQTFTVDVQLSGIAAGQQLDSLLGSVLFESNFLSIPTVSAGPIVPNPSDFFAADFAGQPRLAVTIVGRLLSPAGVCRYRRTRTRHLATSHASNNRPRHTPALKQAKAKEKSQESAV